MEISMADNPFLKFLFLGISAERRKHAGIIALSVVIVFLLSGFMFVSSSIRHSIMHTLSVEPDFVYQRVRGERVVNVTDESAEKLMEIRGVTKLSPRVYGRYFVEKGGRSFLVIGIDFLDEQSDDRLEKLVSGLDIDSFLEGGRMVVGERVARWLKEHFYGDRFTFITPGGESVVLEVSATFPRESGIFSDDTIVVPIETARKIFAIAQNEASDYTFDVPNDSEWDSVRAKAEAVDYDARVVSRRDSEKIYRKLFNFKEGIFLMLFTVVLTAFAMILYQRYSQIYSSERRHIGLLRALGWSISDVLKLKFMETFFVVSVSFAIGVGMAYIYVFVLGAPVLITIFMGADNGVVDIPLVPVIEPFLLISIFVLYSVPFFASVLIPVWKISVSDPREAMS